MMGKRERVGRGGAWILGVGGGPAVPCPNGRRGREFKEAKPLPSQSVGITNSFKGGLETPWPQIMAVQVRAGKGKRRVSV